MSEGRPARIPGTYPRFTIFLSIPLPAVRRASTSPATGCVSEPRSLRNAIHDHRPGHAGQ